MKDNQNRVAHLAATIIYIIMGIVGVATCIINERVSGRLAFADGILVFASMVVVLMLINQKRVINYFSYAVFNLFYMIQAVIICIGFSSRELIIPLVFICLLINIMFFEKGFWIVQCVFQIAAEVFVLYYDTELLGEINTERNILVMYILITIAASWLGDIVISYVLKQLRISYEQQQSLDDLIKVVEAKCADARTVSKFKSNFLANMSHELRTPLNAILGMNMLIERDSEDEKIREYTSNIDIHSKELLAKINDMIEYAMLDTGKLQIEESEYQLLILLNDINNLVRPLVRDKKLKFVMDINEQIPVDLYGDSLHIKQIIMNLITNAIKYTKEGSVEFKLDFERIENADYIDFKIQVSDTGIGIKEENLDKIFEPFESDDEETRYIQGTGVGLVTVKALSKLMGGEVEVYSTFGQGSTFRVDFPQRVMSEKVLGEFKTPETDYEGIHLVNENSNSENAASKDSVAVKESANKESANKENTNKEINKETGVNDSSVNENSVNAASVKENSVKENSVKENSIKEKNDLEQKNVNTDGGQFKNLKILVVDDVSVNLKVFKGLLKKTEAVIDTANSGMEALELVKNESYNIIFLDHMMPEMDGVETLNKIKELPDFSIEETPVIVLTANAIAGAKEEYLDAGFIDYITKPIKKEELFGFIEKYTNASECSDNGEGDNVSSNAMPEDKPMTLGDFTFLDTEAGLVSCGGDENLYFDVIKEYCVSERTNEMDTFYSKNDWKNYEILVHALKSTSKAIGANRLSEMAKALEYAAKENDIEYIKANHEATFEEYKNLLLQLNSKCSGIANKREKAKTGASKYLVYVVDDDSVNLKVAEGILDKFFEVETFASGQEVTTKLENTSKENLPNLILLDIKMPDMSGFDVIGELKNSDKWKEIPVIFLTAEDDIDVEIQGFQVGAMDFIRKPFAPQIMLERVNRIIELNQLKNYLESEVSRKTSKVEKLSLQAMQTLAMTIDAKDKYTNGHSTRVAKYSRMLAERIGFSSEDLETIYYMGLLHDIGKIGVLDSIINKDGKLTDEEFAAIKKHPEIGYGILKNITEIPDIEKGARWHHERYDGRGYPDGLKGVEIPLFARIIAVADSYDAMTSKRSYRDVLPQDFVREELVKGKGTQFDPSIADIMVKLIDEDKDYNMKEQ